jgi:polygalacturonase
VRLQQSIFAGIALYAAILSTAVADVPVPPPPVIPLPTIPDGIFDVTKFGAVGNGKTDDTADLQAAIDAAAAAGGGTVLLPGGKHFLSNPLTVKSHNIRVQIDGTLLCQTRPHYSDPKTSLLSFLKCHDIELCGSGTIEGQGGVGHNNGWWGIRIKHIPSVAVRPRLVRFNYCDTVYIHDLSLRNAPSFHFIFRLTNNVTIDKVKIFAPSSEETQVAGGELTSHNTDGIDPHGSNYLIENCNISDGDDDIAAVASEPVSKNIYITHCTFGTGHGLSFEGSSGSMDGLTVTDCTFDGTTNGIRLKANREQGGIMQNILYNNLTMHGVRFPILFTSYYPYRDNSGPTNPTADPGAADADHSPVWRNVTIQNLTATGGPAKGVVGMMWGLSEAPISNVALINVKISASRGLSLYHVHNLAFDKNTHFDNDDGNTLIATLDPRYDAPIDATVLPAGFINQEIGNPKVGADACRSLYDPDIFLWTLLGEGAGVAGPSDQLNYCCKPAGGLTGIQAQLNHIETGPGMDAPVSQAGLMLRTSEQPDAPYAAVFQTSDGKILFQWRTAVGATTTGAPAVANIPVGTTQLRLTHSPEGVSAFYSTDSGSTWTQVGSAVAIPGADAAGATIGIAATCNSDGGGGPAIFANVRTSP